MKVLELFSGTGSVGKVCKKLGWEVISLDKVKSNNPDICTDILDWNNPYKEGDFDIIWSSPPCHSFSQLRKCWIGRKTKYFGDKIITRAMIDEDIEKSGLPILYTTMNLIAELNPKYWFIENPYTSDMKKYIDIQPYTVDYCMYSNWGYKKKTNIWSNLEGFTPLLCNKKCGNMINDKFHKVNLGNQDRAGGGQVMGTTTKDRYRIPEKLIFDLFKLVE